MNALFYWLKKHCNTASESGTIIVEDDMNRSDGMNRSFKNACDMVLAEVEMSRFLLDIFKERLESKDVKGQKRVLTLMKSRESTRTHLNDWVEECGGKRRLR